MAPPSERHWVLMYPFWIDPKFISFVGTGQPSLVHLAEFAYAKILPSMAARVKILRDRYPEAKHEERLKIVRLGRNHEPAEFR